MAKLSKTFVSRSCPFLYFIADLHFGDTSDCIEEDGIPSKLTDTLKRVVEVMNKAVTDHAAVVIGGDIFDSTRPDPLAWKIFHDIIAYAEEREISLYIYPGNHDCSSKWNNFIATTPLPLLFTEIITVPSRVNIKGLDVFIVPHIAKSYWGRIFKDITIEGDYVALIKKEYKTKPFQCLLTHAQFANYSGSETEMEAGNAIILPTTVVPSSVKILTGHVHKALQEGNLTYPGTLVPHTFGEIEKEQYAVYRADHSVELVPYKSTIKEYKHVKINLCGKLSFDSTDEKIKEVVEGKLLKISILCDKRERIDLQTIRDRFEKYGTVLRFEVLEKQDADKKVAIEQSVGLEFDPASLLDEYLDGVKDKKEIIEEARILGKEIVACCSR
jgi:DNA repair exonuclease SbcCD nuclease subunit